jgi:hypothetical protein
VTDAAIKFTYVAPDDVFGVDVLIQPEPDGGGGYVLRWSDQVVNVWAERYPTLALALARVAVLVDGVRQGRFFVHQSADDRTWTDPDRGGDGPPAFVEAATKFLADQLEPSPTTTAATTATTATQETPENEDRARRAFREETEDR